MKHKLHLFYFLVLFACFIFAGSKKHQYKPKHHDKLRATVPRRRYLQDVKNKLNARQLTSSLRSGNRQADLDDGEEHNVTVIYDRANGLTGHHHHNQQKNQKHKQTFMQRKGSKDSVKASKRQYMPLSMDQDNMYSGMRPRLFTSSDNDAPLDGGGVDGGLLPIGPVEKVLGNSNPLSSGAMLNHAGFEEDITNVPSTLASVPTSGIY